ncbi:family 20 glycosylhydrolase [Lysobacter sp. 5GHs7-4]|uniref:family 20 glycosylhydrolase n=1 Tax=Lysobacter sp. 5GHs7-4 TaxID=2904253 RepID=UPI001E636AAF|nr:family 20 glycosylhydrolase [Lysobacter sp. 5GHs7-4]UHQ23523.1 family 20 glycosylhydrolase [Lysobacter sp. 5GHs7-4]
MSSKRMGAALAAVVTLTLVLPACQRGGQEATTEMPAAQASQRTPVIPLPAKVLAREGRFVLDAATRLQAAGGNADAARIARDFAARVQRMRGFAPNVDASGAAQGEAQATVVFAIDKQAALPSDEAYTLEIGPEGARIEARAPAGLFYGAVTLWQLATADGARGAATIAAQRIEDAPRFGWRGLMLDSARHFQSVEQVKALIDQMALHKLNTFHWHLTDDQGWRIEIKKYPKLTQVGSCRIPAGASGHDPATGAPIPYCGYYTQDQIRDVVRYAAERYVTIVPEIEMPGHAQAAIAAYPELGVSDVLKAPPPVSPDWGVHTYLFNTQDSTFVFLEDVLAEVTALFPGRYIHIGGDEAAKDQWQASPSIQAQKAALGLKDEMAMQSWFVARIEKYLGSHNRSLIGWDEILEGGLPPRATVMSWRGIKGAVEAARSGHDVVLAPAPDLYFDHVQSDNDDEATGRMAAMTLKSVYGFEPVPAELTPEQGKHVLGAQANLWTEHKRTFEAVERAYFPRTAALAEAVWSPKGARDWDGFLRRLVPQMARYQAQNVQASDAAFAVRFQVERDGQGQPQLKLSNQVGFGQIRYLEGKGEVNAQSAAYAGPLALRPPTVFQAATYVDGRALSAPRRYAPADLAALTQRTGNRLRQCQGGLNLRMEDDAPADGIGGRSPRAVLLADVFDPCWIYEGAALDQVGAIEVRVGQVPFNYQLWHDTPKVVTRAANGAEGALEVRADHCQGALVATLPLGSARRTAGLTTLRAKLVPTAGTHDLCLVFASGSHDPLWAIERVTLQPR